MKKIRTPDEQHNTLELSNDARRKLAESLGLHTAPMKRVGAPDNPKEAKQ